MAVMLRRKRSQPGIDLYQVWPDDHPAYLPEPPWRPASEFSRAIKGAIAMAFLLLQSGDEYQFSQEEWDEYMKVAMENAASDYENSLD